MINEKGHLKKAIIDYCNSNDITNKSYADIARELIELHNWDKREDSVRRKVGQYLNEQTTKTTTNQYKKPQKHFSAIGEDNTLMDIDTYCKHYGLPRADVKSYKLVSHTSIPYYNIAFFEQDEKENLQEAKEVIEKFASKFKYYRYNTNNSNTAVIKISDIHFGSLVTNLIKTKDYSTNLVAELFQKIAAEVNKHNYSEVHVHLLGDLIESFTGLNHKNSWKNIEHSMVGAAVIKMCVSSLHLNLLTQIKNLKSIKIIGGNHDRLTSSKDEDTESGAADLIAWGLDLIGYDVEFNSNILQHEVDGISHILLHGHNVISKRTTQQICWDYGVQGKFNLVSEGHLHSFIEKASAKAIDNFNLIKDDGIDHLRMVCRSLYTGNNFSEYLGYYSLSGFHIITNNGNGKPNINNIIL